VATGRNQKEKLELAVEATGLGIFDFEPLTGKLGGRPEAKRHFGLPPDAEVTYELFLGRICL
jgi:hypothetical protein